MCETKNENSSNLLRGISENGGILFYGIDSTAVVRRMEQLHKTSAVTTAALGRLLTGVAMSISVSLLDFPQNTLTNYMAFFMLILAALSGLIGWNHFLPCILSGMLYFGFFLAFVLPVILLSDSNWYGILMLLPTLITVVHALYARFRNREPVQ